MRNAPYVTSEAAEDRAFGPLPMVFQAASDHEPPAPAQMFARLGLLLAIALGFGLIAQVLVGVPV